METSLTNLLKPSAHWQGASWLQTSPWPEYICLCVKAHNHKPIKVSQKIKHYNQQILPLKLTMNLKFHFSFLFEGVHLVCSISVCLPTRLWLVLTAHSKGWYIRHVPCSVSSHCFFSPFQALCADFLLCHLADYLLLPVLWQCPK